MSAAPALRLATILVLISVSAPHAAEPLSIPAEARWSDGPGFSFATKADKHRRSLSGIACPAELALPRRCVAVFDEGVEARYVVIDGQGMSPEPDRIMLLAGGEELDAEGAARDGSFVFVTGSHSAKRGSCANNPDGRHVLRFGVDPATGQARRGPDGTPADLISDNGRLWNLMTQHPVLRDFAGDQKCLGSRPPPDATHLHGLHGVNIEGLAAKNGQLYFGFREPAIGGHARILRVAAGPLFSGGNLADVLFTVAVGQARGIRDLLAVPEGLLLLIGPDDDSRDTVGWSIAFWDGAGSEGAMINPKILAHLVVPPIRNNGCDKEIKPEALALLEDGPDFRRVLVLSDGMCDGGPMVFRIPK